VQRSSYDARIFDLSAAALQHGWSIRFSIGFLLGMAGYL
jgi:hypothetical protein